MFSVFVKKAFFFNLNGKYALKHILIPAFPCVRQVGSWLTALRCIHKMIWGLRHFCLTHVQYRSHKVPNEDPCTHGIHRRSDPPSRSKRTIFRNVAYIFPYHISLDLLPNFFCCININAALSNAASLTKFAFKLHWG